MFELDADYTFLCLHVEHLSMIDPPHDTCSPGDICCCWYGATHRNVVLKCSAIATLRHAVRQLTARL